MERACRVRGNAPTAKSVEAAHCGEASFPDRRGMPPRAASARKFPDRASDQRASATRGRRGDQTQPFRSSVPRADNREIVGPLHEQRRDSPCPCRFPSSSRCERSHVNFSASFSQMAADPFSRGECFPSFVTRVQFRVAIAFLAGNSAEAERSFFIGSSLSLLAEPPARPPLRGRGAFGSSLKGIPPTVPSSRLAPPPRDERAIPLLNTKKELYARQNRSTRNASRER